ncbi:MAG: transcriptional repressor [Clostridia bacterium]|nr:transcriptional repressor [Clostridia bacterium]
MGTVKHSRQRDAVKAFLMSRKDHPTADVVYSYVRKEFPNISLGTVYRNLSFLVEHGEAVTVPCEDGYVHFDANTRPHLHFQCRKCKCLIDIEGPANQMLDTLEQDVSSYFPGRIDAGSVCFYGLCENCNSEKN